jgi:hypothetical protein
VWTASEMQGCFLTFGARSSAVMCSAYCCSGKLLALMKSADLLPNHVNALEAL